MANSFLALPFDVRQTIYSHVLVFSNPFKLCQLLTHDDSESHMNIEGPDFKEPGLNFIDLSLLQCSKQIYKEGSAVFWEQNVFEMDRWSLNILTKKINNIRTKPEKLTEHEREKNFQHRLRHVFWNLDRIRHFHAKMSCTRQNHPGLDVSCMHIDHQFPPHLRDFVYLFFSKATEHPDFPRPRRTLEISARILPLSVITLSSMVTFTFDHSKLKKLNYRETNPPWADGDTVDVLAGALKDLDPKHTVTLWVRSLADENADEVHETSLTGDLQRRIEERRSGAVQINSKFPTISKLHTKAHSGPVAA